MASDLGRRWLAAGGPWLPGMLIQPSCIARDWDRIEYERESPLDRAAAPDLNDHATLGAAVGHLATLGVRVDYHAGGEAVVAAAEAWAGRGEA